MQDVQGPGRRSFLFISGISLLILLAFALRAYRIDWQSLWPDENFTMFMSSQDLATITKITSEDVHPPLYYFLLHYWVSPTGFSEFSLRFPSLFFSVLVVPLVWKTASFLAGRRVAFLAASLMSIAPFQVYYAQEARMYSLITFLSLASTYAMVRVAGFSWSGPQKGQRTQRNLFTWIALALSSAALLYAHYFGFLVLLVQNSVVALTRLRKRRFFLQWCLSQVAIAALFAPWIPIMTRVYVTNDEDWRHFVPFVPMFQEVMVSLSLGKTIGEAASLPLAASFFLALLAGMAALALKKETRPLLLLLGLSLFQPILLTYLVSFTKPVYGGSRYMIFVAPAFYILISLGLTALRERWRPVFVAILAFLVLASGYSLANHYWDPVYAKDDYRGMARVMEAKALPEDGVVIMNGVVFDYYYKGHSPRIALPQEYPISQGNVIDALNRFSLGKSRLWFLRWEFNGLDPDNFIMGQLEDHGEKIEEGVVRGLRYTLYRLTSDTHFHVAAEHSLSASFDHKVSLEGYSLNSERIASGKTLDVTFNMKASQKLDQDYKISLSLTDAQGYRWVQEDKPPTSYSMSRWRVGEVVQTRLRVNIPVGVPPGEYSLDAIVYSPTSLEPVPIFDSNHSPLGAALRLGSIQVTRGQLPYDPASVAPSNLVDWEPSPDMRLLGYDMSAGEVDQGGTLTLMLYWQALSKTQDDYHVSIRLRDERGNSIQEYSERPHHGQYPTTEWQQGEIVRDAHSVTLPGTAPPGKTKLEVALATRGSSCCLQVVELAPVLVKQKARSFELPAVEHPKEADLGGKVRFLGYALSGQALHPGDKMPLTLYWQAITDGTASYAVFTHLLDGQNRVLAQHDGLPASGTEPTSSWVAGQTITDLHQLPLKPDLPPGDYVLEIGVYDPASGQRLKLPDGADRILLEKVRVQ